MQDKEVLGLKFQSNLAGDRSLARYVGSSRAAASGAQRISASMNKGRVRGLGLNSAAVVMDNNVGFWMPCQVFCADVTADLSNAARLDPVRLGAGQLCPRRHFFT